MGPRLFRRGDESFEIVDDGVIDRFNGATPFQAWRRTRTRHDRTAASALQWGHAFSGVETPAPIDRIAARVKASMGPRLFRRGDIPQMIARVRGASLQWGHAFSGVETCRLCWRFSDNAPASMGPRLFRRGDARGACARLWRARGFNGATPFQAWRRA